MDAVDVIEDQCHAGAVPFLALTAQLAAALLQALGIQAALEVGALVVRVNDQDLVERTRRICSPQGAGARPGRVEVVRRDPPRRGVALDRPEVPSGVTKAE